MKETKNSEITTVFSQMGGTLQRSHYRKFYFQVYECIDLLKSLPENERLACGQRIIQYIVVLLNDLINIDEVSFLAV